MTAEEIAVIRERARKSKYADSAYYTGIGLADILHLLTEVERQAGEIAALQECALDDDNLMTALMDLAGTRDCHGWPEAIERITVKHARLAMELDYALKDRNSWREQSRTNKVELVHAIDERDCLRAEVERLTQWVKDLHSGMYVNCIYCGHRYGPDPGTPVAMADVLKQHIEQCPKHPMSALRAEVGRQAGEIERARTYTGFEAYGCPLCVYREGVLTQRCTMHAQIDFQAKEITVLQECALDDENLMEALVDLTGTRDCHGWPEAIERIKAVVVGLRHDNHCLRLERDQARRNSDHIHKELEGTLEALGHEADLRKEAEAKCDRLRAKLEALPGKIAEALIVGLPRSIDLHQLTEAGIQKVWDDEDALIRGLVADAAKSSSTESQ